MLSVHLSGSGSNRRYFLSHLHLVKSDWLDTSERNRNCRCVSLCGVVGSEGVCVCACLSTLNPKTADGTEVTGMN